ncbi:MAG: hypothetical protein KA338_11400, partial [Chloroflexi bacterium]|nr:hypothetical protein [Chloroflexota bacterium]
MANWQIARTIYQIVLQIFIPLGVRRAHGELLRKCRAIWQIAQWTIYQIVLQIFIPLGVPQAHGELLRKCRAIWQIGKSPGRFTKS